MRSDNNAIRKLIFAEILACANSYVVNIHPYLLHLENPTCHNNATNARTANSG